MPNKQAYLVVQTRKVRVDAASAAEARTTAEAIFQLNPDSKVIITQTHVEKVRN